MTTNKHDRDASDNNALRPVPKLENDFYDWYARHEEKRNAARGRNHDLVFIGDSITHLFEGHPDYPGRGEALWRERYGDRALNLGFGWDRTQNVLWRLEHGEFEGQTPRRVVLLIGTNNFSQTANARANTPPEIAAGVAAVLDRIAALSPRSRTLLLAVFPRSTPADPIRAGIRELNALLAVEAKRRATVDFLDFGARFLAPDGTIPVSLMADATHPTADGYRIWADAIQPFLPALRP